MTLVSNILFLFYLFTYLFIYSIRRMVHGTYLNYFFDIVHAQKTYIFVLICVYSVHFIFLLKGKYGGLSAFPLNTNINSSTGTSGTYYSHNGKVRHHGCRSYS